MPTITSDFDHGNIHVLNASAPQDIRLEIKPDTNAKFHQWFYYRVDGAAGTPLTMQLTNVADASYPRGWINYNAVASYDGESWFRVETDFDNSVLTIRHTPDHDQIFYAYFAAYPLGRVHSFVDQMREHNAFDYAALGKSLDGEPIHYFTIGNGPLNLWVIARQHPGETMGSWWMEGFLPALLEENEITAKLLSAATLHVVPCMNPDGARRGHLRTNAGGSDLNRAWQNASVEVSPEVHCVREKMRETGVDFFLDVHGDEAIPNNFLNSTKGIPSWDARLQGLYEDFCSRLLVVSKDFQTKDNYPDPAPGQANLDIANNAVGEGWNCLAMTLEMPFKDAAVNPDPAVGWSPERCRSFAREHLVVMAEIVDRLR